MKIVKFLCWTGLYVEWDNQKVEDKIWIPYLLSFWSPSLPHKPRDRLARLPSSNFNTDPSSAFVRASISGQIVGRDKWTKDRSVNQSWFQQTIFKIQMLAHFYSMLHNSSAFKQLAWISMIGAVVKMWAPFLIVAPQTKRVPPNYPIFDLELFFPGWSEMVIFLFK